MQNRREFLRNTMLAGAGCLAAGAIRADARVATDGAPMLGFTCKPLETVRVGVVGIGSRGIFTIAPGKPYCRRQVNKV